MLAQIAFTCSCISVSEELHVYGTGPWVALPSHTKLVLTVYRLEYSKLSIRVWYDLVGGPKDPSHIDLHVALLRQKYNYR